MTSGGNDVPAIALEGPQDGCEINRDDASFRRAFDEHLSRLPALQARAFRMREVEGLAPARICALLAIGSERLEELLFEARLAICQALARDGLGR
jgi:DNA-directed RNA polymerase specialized sigma24 family protein